jgi:hypothetical protein
MRQPSLNRAKVLVMSRPQDSAPTMASLTPHPFAAQRPGRLGVAQDGAPARCDLGPGISGARPGCRQTTAPVAAQIWSIALGTLAEGAVEGAVGRKHGLALLFRPIPPGGGVARRGTSPKSLVARSRLATQ